jgi:hypothetical protein
LLRAGCGASHQHDKFFVEKNTATAKCDTFLGGPCGVAKACPGNSCGVIPQEAQTPYFIDPPTAKGAGAVYAATAKVLMDTFFLPPLSRFPHAAKGLFPHAELG